MSTRVILATSLLLHQSIGFSSLVVAFQQSPRRVSSLFYRTGYLGNSSSNDISITYPCQNDYRKILFGKSRCKKTLLGYHAKHHPEEEEEEGHNSKGGDEDWRSFRANLVSKEHSESSSSFVMKDYESAIAAQNRNSWIYDAGLNIECGTILLNHPSATSDGRNRYRYALSEQWLHKSLVFVLECDPSQQKVTGILLNRPTDVILYDEHNNHDDNGHHHDSGAGWEIWFGGDEHGIHSHQPKFFTLHSIDTPEALKLSDVVIPGIYFSSLQNAKDLVMRGLATSDDFWVFCGFQTWNRQELEEELREGLWHAVATDASLVEKGHELLKNSAGARSDGDRTWKILMRLIGQRFDSRHKCSSMNNSFSDRMLQEWSVKRLEFDEPPPFLLDKKETTILDSQVLMSKQSIKPGTLIQASFDCSKHLMSNQQFHRSTILIIQDDDDMSVGIMLNMPSHMSVDLWMNNDNGSLFDKEMVSLPLRYGGPLGGPCYEEYCENEPLFCFHLSSELRKRNIGEPIGEDMNGIWRCSYEELVYSIEHSIAFVEDFALVDGICVWRKDEDEMGNKGGGILKEIQEGYFEIVPSEKLEEIWQCLSSMEVLETSNVDKNFMIMSDAWNKGSAAAPKLFSHNKKEESLHDEALKIWMEIFLIGDSDNNP